MAKQSKDTISKLRAKIKKLEEQGAVKLKALEKMPNIRGVVYGSTFAGLTYAYYYGLTTLLPKFLFQFGTNVKLEEEEFQNAMLAALLGGGAGNALALLGVPVGDILRDSLGITHIIDPIAGALAPPTGKGLGLLGPLKEAIEKTKEAVEEQARTKEAGGVVDNAEVIKNQKIVSYWTQIDIQYKTGRLMWAMGMAGGTMLFLSEMTPSKAMDIAAKALDAVTPFT